MSTPTGVLFQNPIVKPLSSNGTFLSGCTATFYLTGSTSFATIYADGALTTPLANPLQADASGTFVAVYLNPATIYRVQIKTSTGVLISDTDPYVPSSINSLTQTIVGQTLFPPVAAEGSSVVNPWYYYGNVLRYGTNTTPGTTPMTTAVQAAVNQQAAGGAPVYAPAGTYLVGTINLPASQYGFVFKGDGPTQTVFVANAANIPIFQKTAAAGALEGADIGNFSIKANAGGSTTTAFLCTGFRTSKFTNIRGISNGTAGFASLFSLAAFPYLCYGNEFDTCGLAGATGWTKAWDFNSGGTNNVANCANITLIINPWIYFNTGLSIGIDALRSSKTNIIGGLIESNAGATAIISGNACTIQGVWIEANAHTIAYQSVTDGASNSGQVIGCYFSTADTIDFTNCSANAWINNTEAGSQTFTNNNGTNVRFQGTGDAPSAPVITRTGGATGTLSLSSNTSLIEPNLTNLISYNLIYSWTPTTAATFSTFTITPPTNWEIAFVSTGMTRNASGQPRATAPLTSSTFTTDNVTNDAHALVVNVMIKHIDT